MCQALNNDSFICGSISSDFNQLSRRRCVPTQTQIRQQLGSKLSDVFFENLTGEARVWLGLEPNLGGPGTVWIDPNSRLENEVTITPVPKPEVGHLRALTHGSILDVGQKYIDLLENKHKLEMQEALKRQAEDIEDKFKIRKANGNDFSGVDESSQCKRVVATLMEHFDNCFNDLVKSTQLRMRKECQLKVEEERAELAAYMLTQLQEAVERRDYELCNDFHEILYGELNVLASRYTEQINNEREISVHLIQETVRKYEKMLKELKVEMELSAVVDVCRAIAQERIECNERVRNIEKQFRAQQEELQEFIEDLKNQNCTLQRMSTERLKRLMQWRKKVRSILTEFQRFINFALKTVPGQSEFLLSMEKLIFKKFPEDSFLLPEDYLHFKKCIKGKELPSDYEEKEKEILKALESSQESYGEVERKESEISGETLKCYQSIDYQEKIEFDQYNFDYCKFKSMLAKRYASDIKNKQKMKKKGRKTLCIWKKKPKDVSIDKSSELYQMLTVVGESEKEHVVPIDCFLRKRLRAVLKICNDDPEFAKIMLGCSTDQNFK